MIRPTLFVCALLLMTLLYGCAPEDLPGSKVEPEAELGVTAEENNAPEAEVESEAEIEPEDDFTRLSKAAEEGDAQAQYELGCEYWRGEGVAMDAAEAVRWFTLAARQGHANAQGALGYIYSHGKGVDTNYPEAVRWYTAAAEQGDIDAKTYLASMYKSGEGTEKDIDKALHWYTAAAEQGDISAQIDLASIYKNGEGAEKDIDKALHWYTAAAEQGSEIAQIDLALMYKNGEGTEKDAASAYVWFMLAAEGNDFAKEQLETLSDELTEEEVSEAERKAAVHLAAIDAATPARTGVDHWTMVVIGAIPVSEGEYYFVVGRNAELGYGDPTEYAGAGSWRKKTGEDENAATWYQKAAELGHARAQASLGDCYYNGTGGVEKNLKEAVRWYKAAAEQAEQAAYIDAHTFLARMEAGINLGWMYWTGEGVEKDEEEAIHWYQAVANGMDSLLLLRARRGDVDSIKWYTAAAALGNVEAQTELGSMYVYGRRVEKNVTEGIRWYTAAAEQNDPVAQFSLANLYLRSNDVKKDETAAFNWCKRAAEQGLAYAQNSLGFHYAIGQGVRKDNKEAVYWYRKAAEQGDASAQFNLGRCYLDGRGVPKNFVTAYAWLNLAAASSESSGDERDRLANQMTAEQVAEAQRLSSEIASAIEARQAGADADSVAVAPGESPMPKSSGTAFMVDTSGYALTAAHVVAGAARIEVVKSGTNVPAVVVVTDTANDVALIKAEGTYPALPVTSSVAAKLGANVFTVGYPNISVQGSSPKLTRGEINSLAGIQDDPRYFQVNVAVQPGNSGGPLVSEHGAVVGIIIGRLDEAVSFETSGALPQNVNYALKSAYFLPLLDSVPGFQQHTEIGTVEAAKGFETIAAVAEEATVIVLAY